jgi:hypothetical protein
MEIITVHINNVLDKRTEFLEIASYAVCASVDSPALVALSRLPTTECSPVPPSQTRGVLYFPRRPPSRKGATPEPEEKH